MDNIAETNRPASLVDSYTLNQMSRVERLLCERIAYQVGSIVITQDPLNGYRILDIPEGIKSNDFIKVLREGRELEEASERLFYSEGTDGKVYVFKAPQSDSESNTLSLPVSLLNHYLTHGLYRGNETMYFGIRRDAKLNKRGWVIDPGDISMHLDRAVRVIKQSISIEKFHTNLVKQEFSCLESSFILLAILKSNEGLSEYLGIDPNSIFLVKYEIPYGRGAQFGLIYARNDDLILMPSGASAINCSVPNEDISQSERIYKNYIFKSLRIMERLGITFPQSITKHLK